MDYKLFKEHVLPHSILDPVVHKDVKVITSRGAKYNDNINLVPVVVNELKALVCEYFVCFMKDPNNAQFGLYVLTGFEPGENLYLQNECWNALYIPLQIRRQPFFIGLKEGYEPISQPAQNNTLLTIDLLNKRVTDEGGEALFTQEGEATKYLQGVSAILSTLLQGQQSTTAFIADLIELALLEPINLTLNLANGEQKMYQGFYGINEQKLAALKDDTLLALHAKSYLQTCHMILSSSGHIQKLVNWKNKTGTKA